MKHTKTFTPEPDPPFPAGVDFTPGGASLHPAYALMQSWWAESVVAPGRCVPSRIHWHDTVPVMLGVCEVCGAVMTSNRTRYCK